MEGLKSETNGLPALERLDQPCQRRRSFKSEFCFPFPSECYVSFPQLGPSSCMKFIMNMMAQHIDLASVDLVTRSYCIHLRLS